MTAEVYLTGARRIVEMPEGVPPGCPISLTAGDTITEYVDTGDYREGRQIYRPVSTTTIQPLKAATKPRATRPAATKTTAPRKRAVGKPPTFSG